MGLFWVALFFIAFVVVIFSVGYIVSRVIKFGLFKKLAKGKKWTERIMSLLFVLLISAVLALVLNIINMGVCLINLMMIWLICDFVAFIVRKITKKTTGKVYIAGICAIVITAMYLTISWNVAHRVVETKYEISTEKNVGDGIRVAYFADSHMGNTFSSEGFAKQLDKLRKTNPDVLFVVGDFVDDDTTKEDMVNACKALGEFQTQYGVYYVNGNHDGGYYNNSKRGYTYADLTGELEKNGVKVLEDEIEMIGDNFYVVGRLDKENEDRMSMDRLMELLSKKKYTIVLDHQPADYDAQEASNVDLVLSGHTHGGQMFPFNKVGEWTGMNCKVYGHEKRTNTDFIVSSGISDWAIKFKSGCKSEYVIIDIK